jgi:uncharacterized protein YyaL (SSP411 family)
MFLKRIYVAILVMALFSPVFLYAQSGSNESVKWKEWNTGYQEALKSRKIMLVDMYTEWCGWCKKMDRDTYTHPGIIGRLSKDFVSIKFNPEEDTRFYIDSNAYSGQQLKMMLTQNQGGGYPTTFFLVPKQNVIHVRIYPGYMNPDQLEKVLLEILEFSKN